MKHRSVYKNNFIPFLIFRIFAKKECKNTTYFLILKALANCFDFIFNKLEYFFILFFQIQKRIVKFYGIICF